MAFVQTCDGCGMPLHCEIWKYCQSTSRVQVLENLRVPWSICSTLLYGGVLQAGNLLDAQLLSGIDPDLDVAGDS